MTRHQKSFRHLSFALAAALGLSGVAPGVAAQGWIDDVVQIEVLDGGTMADGTHRAAIRLTLEEGWKTYWRAPGDAGIPPELSWRGSRNLAGTEITWPTPHVFDQYGMRSVGYARELVLPIDITPKTPGDAIRLKGKMELGVCEEVCIPSTLRFDHMLDPEAPRHPAILAARADRPYSAEEAGVRSATCAIRPTEHGLEVEARITMPPAGGAEFTVTEAGDPQIWVSETVSARSGATLVTRAELMHVNGGSFALDRSALRFTVLGDAHAVDIRGCDAG